jgi:hypothetical protein
VRNLKGVGNRSERTNRAYAGIVQFANLTALDVGYPPESVIMFCRPSHEGFVEKTIERALKCGVTEILYVGLPMNRRHDLGCYSVGFRRVLSDVGRKRENVYRLCRDSTAEFEHSAAK